MGPRERRGEAGELSQFVTQKRGGGAHAGFPRKIKALRSGEVYHDGARETHSEKTRRGKEGEREVRRFGGISDESAVLERDRSSLRDSRLVLERIPSPTLCSTMFIFPSRGLFRK